MDKVTLKRIMVSCIIILFVGSIFLLSRIDQRENFMFIQDEAFELNSEWTVEYLDQSVNNVTLPMDLNLKPNEEYTIRTILPDLGHSRNTILLRSSMQDMEIYLDGVLIREHKQLESLSTHTLPISLWLLVTLPDNYNGKELVVKISSPIKSLSGVINVVKLDSKEILLFGLVKDQTFGLIIFSSLFITGLVLIISSFFIKINQDLRIFYLGLMALSMSLWVLSETRLLQFITGNRFIIGSLSYLMVPIMAIFFALYTREAIYKRTKHKEFILHTSIALSLIVILNIVLQLYGILDYIESMNYTLAIILIASILGAYLMVVEIKKYQNETAKQMIKCTIVLFISVVFEISSFFMGNFGHISYYLRVGSFIFFLLLILDTFIYIRESVERRNETQLLEKLAYKDFITGGLNRTSYEKELEKIIESKKTFRLNLLDLNYLKYINDNYGHNVGDEAIILVYNAMELSFLGSGTPYRIGGDEFAVILYNTDDKLNKQCIEKFNLELSEINKTFVHPLNVAIGTDIYTYDEWEQFSKFYHHVDQKMYENKTKTKSAESS